MSSILKGLLQENSKRTVKSVADEIANYIGDSPSDSAIVDAVEHEAKIHGFDPSKLFDAVYDHFRHHIDENLHKWFKEKWVRFGPDGKIRGDCARGSNSEGKPKCLPKSKAQNLGKKGRASAASRKRREDPNPERSGKAINVNTKKKTNEDKKPEFMKAGNMKPFTASGKEIPGSVSTLEKLLVKAKERGIKLNYANIDQMMQAVAKKHHLTGDELHNEFVAKHHMIPDNWIVKQLDEACWKGYHKEGNKKMFGKTYPNCVKNTNEEQELDEKCPHCGGELVSEELMNEKQDACYHKVKSRYKVWPSAYASGALVQCRKKGASNWGNGSKSNESIEEDQLDEKWTKKYKDSINCSNPKGFSQKAHCAGKKKNESSIMKGLVDEAGNAAQQAAIAVNMKKQGKKPKDVDESRQEQGQRRYKVKPAGQIKDESVIIKGLTNQ